MSAASLVLLIGAACGQAQDEAGGEAPAAEQATKGKAKALTTKTTTKALMTKVTSKKASAEAVGTDAPQYARQCLGSRTPDGRAR